jgi:hypothetical protein
VLTTPFTELEIKEVVFLLLMGLLALMIFLLCFTIIFGILLKVI